MLQNVRGQVASQFGFEIVFARTEIGGYCSHCQALRDSKKTSQREAAEKRRPPHVQTAGG